MNGTPLHRNHTGDFLLDPVSAERLSESEVVSAERARQAQYQKATVRLMHDRGNARLARDLGIITAAECLDETLRAYQRYEEALRHES